MEDEEEGEVDEAAVDMIEVVEEAGVIEGVDEAEEVVDEEAVEEEEVEEAVLTEISTSQPCLKKLHELKLHGAEVVVDVEMPEEEVEEVRKFLKAMNKSAGNNNKSRITSKCIFDINSASVSAELFAFPKIVKIAKKNCIEI